MENIIIRSFHKKDYPSVKKIYQEGIDTKIATFETQAPEFDVWSKSHNSNCTLVAIYNDDVIGFITLTPFSSRYVYRGVGEVSVYVASEFRNLGVGLSLMESFVKATEEEGFWMLLAKIFPENLASLKLHKRNGFRVVGRLTKIGQTTEGIWKDNIFLERRSEVVGK